MRARSEKGRFAKDVDGPAVAESTGTGQGFAPAVYAYKRDSLTEMCSRTSVGFGFFTVDNNAEGQLSDVPQGCPSS